MSSAFRTRPLGHVGFPHVFLDATFVKGRVVSRAIVAATLQRALKERSVSFPPPTPSAFAEQAPPGDLVHPTRALTQLL